MYRPDQTSFLQSLAAIFILTAILQASDLFPVDSGYTWQFSYARRSLMTTFPASHTTDSGTITWTITNVAYLEKFPVEMRITIHQTRLLRHRYGNAQELTFDTIFDPPVETVDKLVLTGCPDSNGSSFLNAPYWSFVHDPDGFIPAGMLDIRDTTIRFNGSTIAASVIDPDPARQQIPSLIPWGPDYHVCAANIGPVGRYFASSPGLTGVTWNECWVLTSCSHAPTSLRQANRRALRHDAFTPRQSAQSFDLRGRTCHTGAGSVAPPAAFRITRTPSGATQAGTQKLNRSSTLQRQ